MSFTANIDEVVAENRNHLLGKHPKWKRVRLKEIATILNGYPFESERFKRSGGTPLIRIRDILEGSTETFYDGDFDSTFLVKRGEILVGMDGDFHCEPWAGEPALLNQRVCKIIPDESRYAKQFLRYLLPGYLSAINAQTPSVTVKHLSSRTIADIPLPLPPLPEQRRIVAEIEKQFTRLDAGAMALRRVQANLKRYRAAVLKAACEGKLVPTEAELRGKLKTQNSKFETGAELLARILAERRKNWTGRGKYPEPAILDTIGLLPLPEGWTWATVEQISNVVRGASPRPAGDPKYFGGNIPWITIGPITADKTPYLKSVRETLNEVGREHSRYIEPHTLLLTNSGATLGVPKISLIGGCINDGVAALLDVDYPLKLYLLYFLRTQTDRLRGVNQGAAQPNLNTTIIKAIMVPLPSLAEQTRIVAEVERRLSVVEELEAVVSASLQRAGRLRQSILQKAFSGELV